MKNKENVVCLKNTGYKVLTNAWYDQTSKLDPQQERMSVVRAVADIVREDIRSQVYNTSEFMPSNDFLRDVDSVVPETLEVFLETLILEKKRGILDVYRRKCVALAHSFIAFVFPRSFVSSLLHGVWTYLYHKFGSRHLTDMLASLGFSASYSSSTVLESSAIMRPDKLELEVILSSSSVLTTPISNDNTGTFHGMGDIMMVTPYESICPERKIASLTTCSAIELVKRNPPVRLDSFQNVNNTGLSDIIIQNVDTINPLSDDINPLPSDMAVREELGSPTEITRMECLHGKGYQGNQSCMPSVHQSPTLSIGRFLSPNVVYGDNREYNGREWELCATIYAENSVEKMMTGHSYARAVRVHTLAHLALAGEVVETLNLTERDNLVVKDVLSDTKNILRAHENKEFQAIVQKFNDAFQNLEKNGPTAKLWATYFRMVTLVKQFILTERMGNWDLDLNTIQLMLPFFHATGHFFYS
ncbi:hypothetical protein JTB14_037574 [Gonioctena quinquepunctata]|nr:hypothetical protein JTB14_037574 [Gonioctena quinquepunctata]